MKAKSIHPSVFLILCFPLCLAAGGLYSYFLPREYYSRVIMEIYPDDYEVEMGLESEKDAGNDAAFLPVQVQILKSQGMLRSVIDEKGLVDKWSRNGRKLTKPEAYSKLLKMVEIHPVSDADRYHLPYVMHSLEIGVYSSDPQEAADIANAIAFEYRKWSYRISEFKFDFYLSKLRDAVISQRKKVEQARAELMKMQERGSGSWFETPETLAYEAANVSGVIEAKEIFEHEKKFLEDLETRYATEKMELRIRFGPCKIVEMANPASSPAYPDISLILMISSGIGLLFAIPGVVILCKSYRRQE